ncbi:ankyrin repeat domain-containing protein [Ginsengibacter hankyongi]|uniref:Ankyrin repeat domain-containing protein n=1 Tax=Ginsengibacter hankyongi TaxID=2607284 RepID=A0A5J5IDP1_9BACT|nr:ankyrin repeat domain-containing protein [Ginsengibacter hankyongi]KAA9037131.1 ankyrin repeat domain-containing protein [Ginsengibacter hankyongi]
MDYLRKIIGDFEIHSVESIKECFGNGVDPNQLYKGKPLIYEMINMYLRGPKFKNCIKAFVDFGLKFDDKVLLSVLLDDAASLDKLLADNRDLLFKTYSLDCTFTPLYEASLLHICAEYNHLACAKKLVEHGADINIKAGLDDNGFGGQTPIFHTVNQHANTCIDVMKFFISQKADLTLTVQGFIWGKGYEWETFIPSVNPISYAMMGLLRQFQRTEPQIYEVVSILLKANYGIDYFPANVPNKYLSS